MSFAHENVETFQLLFERVREKIISFPGCEGVKLLRDIHNPNIFFTYSLWENDAALQAYRKSALFDDTWTKTKALFNDKPQAWSVQELKIEN